MTLDRTRDVLFALALGLLPLAAGCITHTPLPSDIARAPAVWSGPPLPLRVGVRAVRARAGEEVPEVVPPLVRLSLFQVMRASRAFAEVRLVDPDAGDGAAIDGPAGVDIVLDAEVGDWDLYSTYAWWALYGLFFAIPFAGTATVILALVLGGPVESDHGLLSVELVASARGGKRVASYHTDVSQAQHNSLYETASVDESIISHPEIVLHAAVADLVQQMGRDRFWLLRFRQAH